MDLESALKDLIINDDSVRIAKTAEVLEGMRYSPILLTDFEDFLRVDSKRFFSELEKVLASDDVPESDLPGGESQQSFRDKKASLLLYHYKLLNRLRRDEKEAWDEINELMEDD